MKMAFRSSASAFLLVLVSSASARAQSPAAQAEVLFRQGRDLMTANKYAEACNAFEASEKLDPAVTTQLNLAECRVKNGQLATALAAFSDAEKAARAADNQQLAQVAANHAAQLSARLSKLTLHVAKPTPGLAITRDGAPVDPATWNVPLPIDGGTYKLAAHAPGHADWTTTITVKPEGDAQTVEVPALGETNAAQSGVATPPQPQPEPHEEPATPHASRMLPIALTAGSAVLLAGALGFELWGDSTIDDANAAAKTDYNHALDLWHSANTKRYVAEGMLGAGLAAGGVAVYFWLRHDDHAERSALAPIVTRDAGGVAWFGSW